MERKIHFLCSIVTHSDINTLTPQHFQWLLYVTNWYQSRVPYSQSDYKICHFDHTQSDQPKKRKKLRRKEQRTWRVQLEREARRSVEKTEGSMGWVISVMTPPYLSSTDGRSVTAFASSRDMGFVDEKADRDLFSVVEQLWNAENPWAGKRRNWEKRRRRPLLLLHKNLIKP